MIPELNDEGALPAGIHDADLEEIRRRFGSASDRRRELMKGLMAVARRAKRLGARVLFVNGSFVTAKVDPGDWDAVLVVPVGFNAASRAAEFLADRKRIRREYGGDLFVVMEDDGEVIDHYVKEVFGHDREGRPKGVLRVRLRAEEVEHGTD